MRSIGSHGSILAILTALTAASSAHAEYVNFTVTPPAGQSVTQIKIEPICATCTAVAQSVPTPVVAAPEPLKPDKPRKPRTAKKPSCDCDAIAAERDAARTDLASCTVTRDKCAADLAAVGDRITAAEAEIKKLNEATAEAAKAGPAPAPPSPVPADNKPQGRGSSRGRGGAASAAVAPAAAPPPAAPPQGQEEDYSPIQIRGKLTTP